MKLLIAILLGTSTSFACPGAGSIGLVLEGQVIGEVSEYDSQITFSSGYALNILTVNVADPNPDDGIVESGDGQWICDERPGRRAGRVACSEIAQSDGAYPLPTGLFDMIINVKKLDEPNAIINFRVSGANMDSDQPRARGMTCGKTVDGSIVRLN